MSPFRLALLIAATLLLTAITALLTVTSGKGTQILPSGPLNTWLGDGKIDQVAGRQPVKWDFRHQSSHHPFGDVE